MTEQTPFAIGTVAQEAARLIEDMATMARSSYSRADDPSPYAGKPATEPRSGDAPDAPEAPDARQPRTHPGAPQSGGQAGAAQSGEYPGAAGDREARDREARNSTGDRRTGDQPAGDRETGESSTGICSVCGADGDDTPASCRICPLCRGIAMLRSVRPETVDLLADLALSVAAGLRDVASRSRASTPPPPSRPGSGGPADGDRTTVQDIHVDDESE